MADSDVAIANRAIQILGSSERIESLTQDHPNARTMNAAYAAIRNALLRKYKWNFAVKRASVAADAAQTLWGKLNRFPFPNDCLRILRDDELGLRLDWKVEGKFIITADKAPLDFKYIAKITDPVQFDPLFDEVFAHHLAVATCKEITGSTANVEDARKGLKEALDSAKQANAYEEDAVEPLDDDWILARL